MPVNEEVAIPRVEAFLGLVVELDNMWDPASNYLSTPRYKQLTAEIRDSVGLIKDICDECAPDTSDRLDRGLSGRYGYSQAVSATQELLGNLRNAKAREEILAPGGPKLSPSSMHPWIQTASAQLWADGHHRQAVKEAASEIFDKQLPLKVQLPRGTPLDQMVNRAFGNIATPFLKIRGVPATGPDRTNAYEGAQHLGLSCISLVRNLRTHNFPGTEDELLEELAMLSRFARIVDSSTI